LIAAEGLHILLHIGRLVVNLKGSVYFLSSLAYDTLIISEKNWVNIGVTKATIILFELFLGSKVNFHKSMLVGINVIETWLANAISMLNFRMNFFICAKLHSLRSLK
jgi:hypothetical protein